MKKHIEILSERFGRDSLMALATVGVLRVYPSLAAVLQHLR